MREALAPVINEIVAAFVFGSIAKGTARDGSEVDLMVVSDSLRYPELMKCLAHAEAIVGRPVNPTLLSMAQWRARSRKASPASRALRGDVVWIVGDAGALE